MSAHVLLNLLNELRKRDKYETSQAFYLNVARCFDKLNNTGARMLDSIYHMTLKILTFYSVKMSRFCHFLRNVIMDVITLRY